MRNKSVLFIFCMAVLPALCQQSAFQSGDGRTSVYLDAPAAAVNFGDSKFSLGYTNRKDKGDVREKFWGFEVFGKASSGVTSLFSANKPKVPEGGGDLSFGFHDPLGLSTGANGLFADDWWLIDVGYSRSYFYVSSVSTNIDSANHYFDRFRAITAYNVLVNGWLFVGLAGGAERRNNLDDLTKVNFQTVVASGPAGSPNTVVKTQSGFFGSYKQYLAAPVYSDLIFLLPPTVKVGGTQYVFAVDGFTRSDVAAANRTSDGGIGLFFTPKEAPTKVLGGVSASWNGGKPKLALVAGWNF